MRTHVFSTVKNTTLLILKPKSIHYKPKGEFKPHREPQNQTTKQHADRERDNKCELVWQGLPCISLIVKPTIELEPHCSSPYLDSYKHRVKS